jgi:hypothetical protein
MFGIIYIGAKVDITQRSHHRLLLKQKWKIQKNLSRYDDASVIRPQLFFPQTGQPNQGFGRNKPDVFDELRVEEFETDEPNIEPPYEERTPPPSPPRQYDSPARADARTSASRLRGSTT